MLVVKSHHASALACGCQLLLMIRLYKPRKNAMLKSLIQIGSVTLTMVEYPILYSFRRCPYAMRARLGLSVAGVTVRLREVALQHKPAALLQISPKATVPVLVLADIEVIHESLDILLWALAQNDPAGWLSTDGQEMALMAALVAENDQVFWIVTSMPAAMLLKRRTPREISVRFSCFSWISDWAAGPIYLVNDRLMWIWRSCPLFANLPMSTWPGFTLDPTAL